MATAEELLNSLGNQVKAYSGDNSIFVIDSESRTIAVPESESLFGVTGDKDVERKYFQCTKIVGDNIDLSQHQIYVAYVFTTTQNNTTFPTTEEGLYHCEDVSVDGDNITFSWLLSGNALANQGFIAFKVMAKKSESDELVTKWNTAPAYGTILLTVPDGEDIAEQYPDVINQILDRLDELEQGGGTGGTSNYNDLSNKPKINNVVVDGDKTASDYGLQPAGNYLIQETDPTVPAWAKNQTKPTYTAEEVGALPDDTEIPSKTSDLTNDSGFITENDVHNIPSGGTAGQVLSKKTNMDYDVEWTDAPVGGDTPRQQMQNTDTTVTLEPNVLYVFPEMASLTVTLAEPNNSNVANEYHFFFTSGATATTLTLNDVLSDAYSIEANMKYEVSILEGVAYIKGVSISAET